MNITLTDNERTIIYNLINVERERLEREYDEPTGYRIYDQLVQVRTLSLKICPWGDPDYEL